MTTFGDFKKTTLSFLRYKSTVYLDVGIMDSGNVTIVHTNSEVPSTSLKIITLLPQPKKCQITTEIGLHSNP